MSAPIIIILGDSPYSKVSYSVPQELKNVIHVFI
jgi:hypothetical protein